jgi:hypothetical protein
VTWNKKKMAAQKQKKRKCEKHSERQTQIKQLAVPRAPNTKPKKVNDDIFCGQE